MKELMQFVIFFFICELNNITKELDKVSQILHKFWVI